jgi:threonine synthase
VLVDPHTAVGIAAARAQRRSSEVPMVCVATAHPAKFPDAVEQATGIRPELPERLADLADRVERFDLLPAELTSVMAYVEGCIA